MRQKSITPGSPSERLVKNIRRATRKHYSAEEKIRIVVDGLRGEYSIAVVAGEQHAAALFACAPSAFRGEDGLAGSGGAAAMRGMASMLPRR